MNKHVATFLAPVAVLGIVGGFAVAHAFQPAAKPAQVQFMQPAASTPTVDVTTSPAVPTPSTTTAAPKPVRTATPVQSKATSAPKRVATVQRQAAVVSETPTTPPPSSNVGTVVTNPDGSTSVSIQPGQAPPPIPAKPAPSPTTP